MSTFALCFLLLLYSLFHIILALQSSCTTYHACLYKINLQNNLNKDYHIGLSLINFGQRVNDSQRSTSQPKLSQLGQLREIMKLRWKIKKET